MREQAFRTGTVEPGYAIQERMAEEAVELEGMKKELAAFDLPSTKRIDAVWGEREMEILLETRPRRALATLHLVQKIKEIDFSDSAHAPCARPRSRPDCKV